jgi:Mor family transcriptional regulator
MNALPNLSAQIDPFESDELGSIYDQIEHSIGDDLAGKLIADFGGQRLYIPRAPAPGDLVTSSIGLVAALAMARTFGGDRIVVPVTNDHARRRARILAMRANHVSVRRIARQLRCSERHVYKVLAAEPRSRRSARPEMPSQAPRAGPPRDPSIVLTLAPPPEHHKHGYSTRGH